MGDRFDALPKAGCRLHVSTKQADIMRPLNYRHLHYFWVSAREGGVTAAAKALHVSQPSISAQIKKLERTLGHALFERTGRTLALTAEGKIVFDYAEEIFRLGRELQETIHGRLEGRPMRLAVGVADTIPKLIAFHLLEPALALADPVRLEVREDRTDRLLADLATHDLDLVLADMPIPPNVSVRAYNHVLGDSAIDIFGPPLTVHRLREGFPESLDGAPFLLPAAGYTLRRSLDEWFESLGIQPRVVSEIEDSALIKVFAEAGAGLFAAPTVVGREIREKYAVERLGRAEGVTERFYAITVERRLKHPAVVAISEDARLRFFGDTDID
jgi:LysR family transcriptional activator of nhaA